MFKTWPYWMRGGVFGASIGVLVWLYDYDFLLNFGGPNTPLSDYVRSMFGINPLKGGAAFFPLYIFVILSLTFGLIFGWLYGKIKNHKRNLASLSM